MNVERVQEILDSKGVVDVDYEGDSVWIKSVDKENHTAEVEMINHQSESKVVNVNKLHEENED